MFNDNYVTVAVVGLRLRFDFCHGKRYEACNNGDTLQLCGRMTLRTKRILTKCTYSYAHKYRSLENSMYLVWRTTIDGTTELQRNVRTLVAEMESIRARRVREERYICQIFGSHISSRAQFPKCIGIVLPTHTHTPPHTYTHTDTQPANRLTI